MRLLASELVGCDRSCTSRRATVLVLMIAAPYLPTKVWTQGETTNAIVGQVPGASQRSEELLYARSIWSAHLYHISTNRLARRGIRWR